MIKKLTDIKVYHILHIDRLESVLSDGYLYCDALITNRQINGTTIGMSQIKERRLNKLLSSFENLTVGQCVPFYFCPRSVMLYVISCRNNPDLQYSLGQDNILHLEFELSKILEWAEKNSLKACYTTSNAGSSYFGDYSNFDKIIELLDWDAINSIHWAGPGVDRQVKENKQAEFLIESKVPVDLITTIGVYNLKNQTEVSKILTKYNISSNIMLRKDWYY